MVSLVAAGGWCAPSEDIFNVCTGNSEIYWDHVDMTRIARIFETGIYEPLPRYDEWLSLPTIYMSRGAIKFICEDCVEENND